MSRRLIRLCLFIVLAAFVTVRTPAPFIYVAGEGWSYEPVGGKKWTRTRAKDQLDVANEAFTSKEFRLAERAARRTVRVWPFSDYAPEAQYVAGRAMEEQGKDEKAFKAYQQLLEKYPNSTNYNEVAERQYLIANRYLAGKWFKLWGVIPFFPSMDKTVQMYEKMIKSGPYSEVAPQAQMNIGAAREKQRDYSAAVKAYESAADRYHDRQVVASDATYKAGEAYTKQAKTAEYDQSVAGHAIGSYTDFVTLFPEDARVPEAQKRIEELRTEQARGSLLVARFYEKKKKWDGALVYYNEVIQRDPNSKYAEEAKQRIEQIKKRTAAAEARAQ